VTLSSIFTYLVNIIVYNEARSHMRVRTLVKPKPLGKPERTEPQSAVSVKPPMPKFHIQLRTDDRVWETMTYEKDDHRSLRIELAAFVGELLRDHSERIWIDQDWRIDVTDEQGLILYVMHISASDTAATMKLKR